MLAPDSPFVMVPESEFPYNLIPVHTERYWTGIRRRTVFLDVRKDTGLLGAVRTESYDWLGMGPGHSMMPAYLIGRTRDDILNYLTNRCSVPRETADRVLKTLDSVPGQYPIKGSR